MNKNTPLASTFADGPLYVRQHAGATIVAIANLKGGVGKTTTTVNLAAALAIRYRVLLVDLDSQASASLSLGIGRRQQTPSVLDVMMNYAPFGRSIRSTSVPGLTVLPAHVDLAKFDAYIANARNHIFLLQKVLDHVRGNYDFILLDCPPALSLVMLNAFVAADTYVVPLSPNALAFEAMKTFFKELETWRAKYHIQTKRLGILRTMVDTRSNHARKILQRLEDSYGEEVFETEIKMNVRLAEAPESGRSVLEYDGSSAGARAYWAFSKEFLARLNQSRGVVAPAIGDSLPLAEDRKPVSGVKSGIFELSKGSYVPIRAESGQTG
ncbi:MAG TPA: ParA family protein [Rhodothermales bacterium]|nr:ParA family protein [Rhodothermales bacterium]HRR09399.1 ParA family protein [Rhodothermales bacterium]